MDKELVKTFAEKHEDIRALFEKHQNLERELEDLVKRPYLTPEEEIREKQIKIEKLYLKERIFDLIKKYQKEGS
ncbi:MAG: YdcH family protein [Caldimicrobium sp.]|nr:YdcH family protein [Caldimicrobium sp.]MCX7612877.1 YdcH family protein [Caldimicrobium sp.]MDW8183595.1 YdcH family protein [Caldimicrobium sp.]